jgi:hypothetical protein
MEGEGTGGEGGAAKGEWRTNRVKQKGGRGAEEGEGGKGSKVEEVRGRGGRREGARSFNSGSGALYKREGVLLEKRIHGTGHENGYRAGTENVILVCGGTGGGTSGGTGGGTGGDTGGGTGGGTSGGAGEVGMKKEERGGREDVGRRGEEETENTLYRDRPSGGGRRRKDGGGGRREKEEEIVKILARKGKEKKIKIEKFPGSRTWPSLFVGFLEPEYLNT